MSSNTTTTANVTNTNGGLITGARELATSSNKRIRSESLVDSMLAEAHDLIGASAEAQALGRLQMSSSYLLLAHARLIALGKRFDRSLLPFPSRKFRTAKKADEAIPASTKDTLIPQTNCPVSNDTQNSEIISSVVSNSNDPKNSQEKEAASLSNKIVAMDPAGQDDVVAAVKTLTEIIIPTGIEFDKTMMEHLAKAALDLHRMRQEESSEDAGEGKVSRTIAWTEEEHKRCMDAVENFGRDNTKEIAKAVGTRTEKEVIAHLRNASEKEKATQTLHHELAAFADKNK